MVPYSGGLIYSLKRNYLRISDGWAQLATILRDSYGFSAVFWKSLILWRPGEFSCGPCAVLAANFLELSTDVGNYPRVLRNYPVILGITANFRNREFPNPVILLVRATNFPGNFPKFHGKLLRGPQECDRGISRFPRGRSRLCHISREASREGG